MARAMGSLVDQAEAALRQGRYADARAALEQALAGGLEARLASEARSMLGLAMVAMGQAPAALEHLRAAVTAEPSEAMFRYNLGRGLEAVGDFAGAVAEQRQAVRLAPGMAALEIALAQALMGAGQFDEARPLLEKFAANPQAPAVVTRLLVQCLAGAGDTHAALDKAKALLPADIGAADAQGRADAMSAASLAHAAMHYGEAADITRALVSRDAADADAATVLAQLLLWTEGPEAAREVLVSARAAGAQSPRLLVELVALGEPVTDEAQAMALRDDVPATERADLLLALAQAADRAGDPAQAWQLASKGKAVSPGGAARDWRATLETQRTIYRACAPDMAVGDGPKQLYLLGTPRSGQSLLQSILAASPQVASLGERGALLQHLLFRELDVAAMAAGQRDSLLRDLAEADRRGIERLVGKPAWVVDKSPLHFAIAGNITRVHPGAKFAAVLRDPADVAVSIWLRRFPPVYDYANDFGAILDHLDIALDALAMWRDEGIAIRLIDFAQFVADPAGEGEALFDWLGLEWSAGYLDPANRTEPVPTYSATQVRQVVGQGGSRGAGPYAEQLEPFAETLEMLRRKQAALLN
ncbi:tetratricopeptide repeat-containing sulfotransferase family protein [Parerythrobacter aestuarii]|uniref:tetratricopeptide repeat-containing sulfotransferase family protein n=1 Tax=Parerythrobacter aestuarii TaxID=3020909 RepID=UPI0024DE524D|nr:tetratricopeptide repeat-containing sulfotransferase family protein [Parerythrobacter aestuarii]